jgi:hypothetical protein
LTGDTGPKAVEDTWYQVRKKVGDMRHTLPRGIVGPGFNDEFGDTYGIIYGFTADGFSHRELRDYVEGVRSKLLRVPDVSKVSVLGAQDERIFIEFDMRTLAGLGFDPAALVAALKPTAIAAAAAPLGWRFVQGDRAAGPEPAALQRQGRRLELHWNRFATVLASSDLVLAMSGTASEQAVALARPVLQLAGPGPQFTEGFAEAQRRLLGPGVQCAAGPVGQDNTLAATARMLGSMLDRLADPVAGPTWRRELEAIAAERLGATGGSDRIAAAIQTILDSPKRALQGD